ncbi:hypothetical protein L208DRAFT_32918 [Tricholoma matsutake]|nr:hypothetical protein L208DRAFT_32918 [Tricholoma matsutake 945]
MDELFFSFLHVCGSMLRSGRLIFRAYLTFYFIIPGFFGIMFWIHTYIYLPFTPSHCMRPLILFLPFFPVPLYITHISNNPFGVAHFITCIVLVYVYT